MRKIAAGIAAASAVALAMGVVPAASAAEGTNPLAAVLTADGDTFDSNWNDLDIVTQAALAVLSAKPSSAVGLLTQGGEALTAFAPRDRAFQLLVADLTGTAPANEQATFDAVAGLGIDTVEKVLLYHVVPGATITAKQALKANGAALTTGTGDSIKVQVRGKGSDRYIALSDRDYNSRNPRVIAVDVNKGNKQIAHVIDRVLRPFDIPPINGEQSLASVLTSDGNKFDRNANDFDIVTEAVLTVLGAKPGSAVSLLTKGDQALTAFVPNDRAFRILAESLTGEHISSESKVFEAVASLGIDTVEGVLLYHVVPGATIPAKEAKKANGAALPTGNGDTFTVQVRGNGKLIKISDRDYNSRNARVIAVDVNKGNKQIAHVVDRVIRPVDLPPVKK